MKKLAFLIVSLAIISCNKDEKTTDYILLNGTIENSEESTAVVRGYDLEEKIPIASNGTLSDTLYLDTNGFYELYIGRERTLTYLENGKTLSFTVDITQFDESITYSGDLAAENNYLAEKYLLSEKEKPFQEVFSMSETDFVTEANSIHSKYEELLNNTEGLSEAFKELESKELDYEHIMNLENFQEYHRYFTGNRTFKVSDRYYEPMENIDYADTSAFRKSIAYPRMLDTHFNRLINEADNDDPTLAYLTKVDESLPDGYAKDQLLYGFLEFGMRPDASLNDVYQIYKSSAPDPENLEKITARYNKLLPLLPGNDSPTFNYENHKGGSTSLSDLNGKYVYIDVWATWCGPCIREIPALKAVEEEFDDKNVAFVSISIDEEKDYDTWKTMVAEKNLGGIQLMADNNWNSDFVENYGILGIPRFILIDPQGKIVSADAPRPSDPKLRDMLQELL
ncbi:TlpA family protein disulfide reductase [Altibacter lentus]|uniref:TlpA family protein disulfide reductase n=1 Tax=Altibacter lentus TaxID=1223410 RepID=UPI00054FD7C0|nr:TlpA disulfide reductase family protein [Altibacter lentus]